MKKYLTVILALMTMITFSFNSSSIAKETITSGKGIWINIWNYPNNPDMFLEHLRAKGINKIYLQISRSNTPAIKHPELLNRILKSAHSRNIQVIGWTYPFLKDAISDAQKFIEAANYISPDGESLDGMAADIEEITNSKAIETFVKRVRGVLGSKYPLIAITFSPLNKSNKGDPTIYAWKTIANNFDVIAPMIYWHGLVQYRSEKGAYDYTMQTVAKIKEYTKNQNIKLHLIGDGQKTSSAEINGFLKAASELQVDGGVSLYPWYVPQDHQIEALSNFKP
ncbi:MAG: hypothetical protein HYR97_03390 [Candidatus Melainabacteria bacterium]|nr:hypothetical protein [Candidatus Melainabacteria bacterium]